MAVLRKNSIAKVFCLSILILLASFSSAEAAPSSLSGIRNREKRSEAEPPAAAAAAGQLPQQGDGRLHETQFPLDANVEGGDGTEKPAQAPTTPVAETTGVHSTPETAAEASEADESSQDAEGEKVATTVAAAAAATTEDTTTTTGTLPENGSAVTTTLGTDVQDENPWIDEGIDAAPFTWPHTRLPVDVTPVHYDLTVQPHIYEGAEDQYHVTGTVDIHLHCQTATDAIIFHAQALKLGQISVKSLGNDTHVHEPSIVRYRYDTEKNMVAIRLSDRLIQGWEYVLKIGYFRAALAEAEYSMIRYGYSGYVYEDEVCGTEVPGLFLMTFSSPAYTRKNFPCFDEPTFKPTYTITMVHKPWLSAFSNMPVWHQQVREDGWMVSQFEKTPPMETYLTELMLADQQVGCRERMWNRIRIRVCCRRSQLHRTTHILNLLPTFIEWMEQFTGMAYPLPKLDVIAAPKTRGLDTVAMEHWGIITAGESQLLYQPEENSVVSLAWVNKIAAHELAHQWYGNTVGAEWWRDIFIKEGITSYVDMMLQAEADRSWDLETMMHFEIDKNHVWRVASDFDTAFSMVPVYEGIQDRHRLFTTMIYYKSISVLFMVRDVLGVKLDEALKDILHRNIYGTTTVEELWRTVSQHSPDSVDMGHVLERWMILEGLPVVTVSRAEDGSVLISQRRFFSSLGSEANQTESLWPIPLSFISSEGQQTEFTWLEEKTGELNVTLPSDGWLILNPGRKGFYRVFYEPPLYEQITRLLKQNHAVLDEITRSALVDDTAAFVENGEMQMEDLANLLSYMTNETDLLPWQALLLNMDFVGDDALNSTLTVEQKVMMRQLTVGIYDAVGWEVTKDENSASRYLRMLALTAACHFNHPDCMDEALTRYQMREAHGVHPDIRPAVYCTAYTELPVEEAPSNEEMNKIFVMGSYYRVPFHCDF